MSIDINNSIKRNEYRHQQKHRQQLVSTSMTEWTAMCIDSNDSITVVGEPATKMAQRQENQ